MGLGKTTGLSKDGHNLRIVQLAVLFTDHDGKSIAEMNMIIKPDSYHFCDAYMRVICCLFPNRRRSRCVLIVL